MRRRLVVFAKPKSHKESVVQTGDHEFRVEVREPPENGLANLAIRSALARYLGVSATRLTLTRGVSARQKFFVLD